MKQETKDFGTRTKWVELGKDITKLRNKTDDLDLAFTRVSVKLDELVALAETARLITYISILGLMVTLLIKYWI